MAVAALLRETFIEAEEYGKELEKSKKSKKKDFSRDLKNEIVLSVLNKEIQLKAHAHRADDILTAIRIAKEFGIEENLSIEHATEAYLIPQYLKNTTLIIGPIICERCKVELKNLDIRAAKILYENNIPFALMTDHPVVPIQYLIICASLLAKAGLPPNEALKTITINAAKACRLEDRIGSIEVGKDADLAVFSGNPLDIMQKVELTVIDGEIVYDARQN